MSTDEHQQMARHVVWQLLTQKHQRRADAV
jgi:hypothetical protein